MAPLELELLQLHRFADLALDRPHRGAGRILLPDDRLLQPHDGGARVCDRRLVRQPRHARGLLRPRQNQLPAGDVPDARPVRRSLLDRPHLAAPSRCPTEVPPSISANIAIRLIQLHMCIIYLFSGLGKLQGESWWNGQAVWYSSANLEYQYLIDMTWLANWPMLVAFLTHATVYWELSYSALVWPRITRPWVLLMAVLVHGGIAVAYGMPTFGLVMLIGNLAFISPETVRAWVDPVANRVGGLLGSGSSRAGRGRAVAAAAHGCKPRPHRIVRHPPHIYTVFDEPKRSLCVRLWPRRHCRDGSPVFATRSSPSFSFPTRRIPSVFESIAIVGATGAVGQLIRQLLEERDFPYEKITFLASKRSAGSDDQVQRQRSHGRGTHARGLRGHRPGDRQHARRRRQGLLSPGPVERGCVVVDESGYWRMDPKVPLVVPEVNPEAPSTSPGHHRQPQLFDHADGRRHEAAARRRPHPPRRREHLPGHQRRGRRGPARSHRRHARRSLDGEELQVRDVRPSDRVQSHPADRLAEVPGLHVAKK